MGGRWERGSGLLLETHHRIWSLVHATITRHHEGGFALLSPFLCHHHRFMSSHWNDVDLKEHLMGPTPSFGMDRAKAKWLLICTVCP